MGAKKQPMRVLRHLARTGGTLITKCLGSMDGVVILSEVHPDNLVTTNPMAQAVEWFKLVTPEQVKRWRRSGGPTFAQFVFACDERARATGRTLVLRDWSHIDYHGIPGAPAYRPAMGSGVREALEGVYELVETATVRHPVDSCVSLMKTRSWGTTSIEDYMAGWAAFADEAARLGYIRYEDFTREPDAALRTLCDRLRLPFDAGYADRWPGYTTVTGDTNASVSRGSARRTIEPLERRPVDPALLERCRAHEGYLHACAVLGYEP